MSTRYATDKKAFDRKPGEKPSEWADRVAHHGLLFDDVLREVEKWIEEKLSDR